MRTSQALATEDPFTSGVMPCTDTLVLVSASHASRRSLPIADDENGPEFELGDKECHACDAASSDYSIHQLLAADVGENGPESAYGDKEFHARDADNPDY